MYGHKSLPSSQRKDMKNFKGYPILFYNVENLFDTFDDKDNPGDDEFTPEGEKYWTTERFQHKLNQLEQAIRLSSENLPACFGLVEIENRFVVEELIRTGLLKTRSYRIVHFNSDDPRGIDCAFVYDEERFTPFIETRLLVRLDDEPDFRTRDILYVAGTIEGNDIHFFVNHWPSRREGTKESNYKRAAAAQVLRRKVLELLQHDESANLVIMGDFNDTPNDASIRTHLKAKGQHELEPNDLVNLLLSAQNKGNGTIVHQRDWEVFDQFIVSQGLMNGENGLTIVDYKAHILKEDTLLYTYENGDQKPAATFSGAVSYTHLRAHETG
jgi:predicted extracellular nuclease